MNKLVVGLGNPGKKYQDTRHNVGFLAVDFLADEWSGPMYTNSSHADAMTTSATVAGRRVLLVKPLTYMNKSGQALQALSNYFDVGPEKILVIHDDVDIPLGSLRVSSGSSAGGHNGVQSIIDTLSTNKFARLRVGIKPDGDRKKVEGGVKDIDTRSHVLGKFSEDEHKQLETLLPEMKQATEVWTQDGVEPAMNEVNG